MMKINEEQKFEIKELNPKDFKKVIDFAISGMHMDWFVKNKTYLKMYGKYFLYLELTRATEIIAAYQGDELMGVLLAEVYGEQKKYTSIIAEIYIKIFSNFQKLYFNKSVEEYDETNEEMFEEYKRKTKPEAEIIFLVTNPKHIGNGVGTYLLETLENKIGKKNIYVFTDDACTYQFYEKRGFYRAGEKDIILQLHEKIKLKCLLYAK